MLYRQELATSLSNSYVTLGAGLIKSIDMEPSVAIHGGLAAKSYEVDTLLPVLNSFSLDMDVGVLELIFNEPVNRSTFDPTGLNIQEESNQGDGGEVRAGASKRLVVASRRRRGAARLVSISRLSSRLSSRRVASLVASCCISRRIAPRL